MYGTLEPPRGCLWVAVEIGILVPYPGRNCVPCVVRVGRVSYVCAALTHPGASSFTRRLADNMLLISSLPTRVA